MRRNQEIKLWREGKLVAGVDEAGRGPLAGPVVACAVILKPYAKIRGVKDSKLLSAEERERLYPIIKANSLSIGIGIVSNRTIDRINIKEATLLAMKRAIAKLNPPPDLVFIDGDISPDIGLKVQSVISGDRKIFSCACASIIAKVVRDRIMRRFHKIYPEYDFAAHKGYGTKRHQENLKRYGPCTIHRLSFAPVRENRNGE